MDLTFYRDKKILVTGHTGFKGAWLCSVLLRAGARVVGYALEPPTEPSLFALCGLEEKMNSVTGDIRDLEGLESVFRETAPELVIHMAAQPLVRESYKSPAVTYEVNVMGTVNVLECVRRAGTVKSFLNVTTDKVYRNREWMWGYRENDELNGYDPYSNSKSCSELVTSAYRDSFLRENGTAVSTARAGNVIGGGDFAADRIIPDCLRAASEGREIIVRNPGSVRPYQHVLEPLCAYLTILQAQYASPELADSYNIGPDDRDCLTTGELADLFCREWNRVMRTGASWKKMGDGGPHEAGLLKLDSARIRSVLGWKPRWTVETAVRKIVEWEQTYFSGGNLKECIQGQIEEYFEV